MYLSEGGVSFVKKKKNMHVSNYLLQVYAYFYTNDFPYWMPTIAVVLPMVVRKHPTSVTKYINVSTFCI